MHGAVGAGAPDGSGLGRPGPGGRNRRRDAPANRQRADPHHGARGGRQLGADSARQVVAQPRAALRLGGVIVLSLPRGEPAGHARLGARSPAGRVPQGADRDLHRPPRGRRTDPDGLPQRCGAAQADRQTAGRPLRQSLRTAAGHPPVGRRNPRTGAFGPAHRPVAKPRPLLRPEGEPLAVAALAAVADLRGPLHAELCAALPGPDA